LLKAILFDLGGTLLTYYTPELSYWDINRIGIGALYRPLQRDGHKLPDENTFCQTLGDGLVVDWRTARAAKSSTGLVTFLRRSLQSWGVTVADTDLQAVLQMFYHRVAPYVGIFDDTVQVLDDLRAQGLKLGIISNTVWTREMHDADLDRFGILHHFQQRIYSSEMPHVKPHTDIFERALAAMDILPEEAAFVGDRIIDDVGGAQAAGMAGVLKKISEREEISDTIQPDAKIRTLQELLPWVKDRQKSC